MVSNDECSCSQKGSNDDTRDRSSASLGVLSLWEVGVV